MIRSVQPDHSHIVHASFTHRSVVKESAMPALTLALLGPPQVIRADGRAVAFRSRKHLALLAYLAVEQRHSHSRDTLLGLLWPEAPEDAARSNLRVALADLRRLLGESDDSFLLASRHSVQFAPASDHALDVAAFSDLLAECAAHAHDAPTNCDACIARQARAVELYRGDFLAGFTLPDSAAFEEWALIRREQLHQQALESLDTLAAAYERQGDAAALCRYARRQLVLEPWREQAHRQLMRGLALAGDRGAALAQYETCRRVLAAELGIEPEAETAALYEQIRTGQLQIADFRLQAEEKPNLQSTINNLQSWGEAPDVGSLYGRQAEAAQLEQWLIHDRCRLIAVLGMGGVGKTALAATAVRSVATHFDIVIWRSLLNAPLFEELLRPIVQILAGSLVIELPASLDLQLALLLDYLRRQRCLLILDNLESVLHTEGLGQMRAGYEGYARLFDQLAHSQHSSCLLLTSRERPQGMALWEGDLPWVRTLRLEGLDAGAGQAILTARGLTGEGGESHALIARYSGNPLALKLVAQTVHELFGGAIGDFLREEAPIFGDIRAVLDQQFARLSALEQEILVWLAIDREAIAAARLRANLVQPAAPHIFLAALRALQRRSLLEKTDSGFMLQNVISEYLTNYLIEHICREIEGAKATASPFASPHSLLMRHALLKAQAKEYVRQSQERLIVQPIVSRLAARLGRTAFVEHLAHILESLRVESHGRAAAMPGYAAGNVLNLLLHMGVDVSGYDFSHLCVWQAYLRGMYVPKLNLAGADLAGSVFTHMFGDIQGLQFRADDELLVLGLSDGILRLGRAMDGELLSTIPAHDATYNFARLHPDSCIAALVGADYSIVIADISGGRTLHRLSGHHHPIWRLCFSLDGQQAASGDTSGQVCVWAVESGRLLRRLQLHRNPITALAFTPDGQKLAGGAVDGTVHLWDLASGELIQTFKGHSEEVAVLEFVLGGAVLATGSHDHTARLWDVTSGAATHVLRGHTQPVRYIASDLAGRILATGGRDTFIVLWDAETGELIHVLADQASPTVQLTLSSNGQLVAASDLNETISVWDVPSGQRLDSYRMHRSAIFAAALSPDGQRMVSGGADWAVYVWDVSAPASAHVITRLPGHRHRIKAIAFSADGSTAASGDFSGELRLWDIRSCAGRALQRQQGGINKLAFSPDGRTLASAGVDGTICMWDVQHDRLHHVLRGHTNVVDACAFSPDGRRLASGSWDRTICLWDAETGALLSTMQGHSNIIHAVVFSPDGRRVISTSFDQMVCLWDPHTGQLVASWPAQHMVYTSLAIHPDGDVLAAGGEDHIIRLLETDTGRVLRELHGHRHIVEPVIFHPNGALLASASQDETIKLWDIAPKGVPLDADACLATLHAPGPYAGMNITGVTGISEAQKAALVALGAVEEEPLAFTAQLPAERPAPQAAAAPQHNLPAALTPLVGREAELSQLVAWLKRPDCRLITLVGPGGIGKTRLALELASRHVTDFADGVFLVRLAPIHDPEVVASAIVQTLGFKESGGQSPQELLTIWLRDKRLLLILDNFEHLLVAAPLVTELLAAAPGLSVLVTSRAALHVYGEHLFQVPALTLPNLQRLPQLAMFVEYPAVTLFTTRIQALRPDFALTTENAPAIVEICARLDGLPLAIELAAARGQRLSPDRMLEHLKTRPGGLQILAGGGRDLPARQQTMRATIAWSYDLLGPAEQTLFRRLAVFAGGWTPEAAEAVWADKKTSGQGDEEIERENSRSLSPGLLVSLSVLEGLDSLVDKSLVVQTEEHDGTPRFTMLETIREYALERMEESVELGAVQRRHAIYYLALVEAEATTLAGAEQAAGLARLEREHDNLRAALVWARESGEIAFGLQLAGALWPFWQRHSHLSEGRRWLEGFLAAPDVGAVAPELRATALSGAAWLAHDQDDYVRADALFEEGLRLEQALGHTGRAAAVLAHRGLMALWQGQHVEATALVEESLALARAAEDRAGVAYALFRLGLVTRERGDFARSAALYRESLATYRALGDRSGAAFALLGLGDIARDQGEAARVEAYCVESLAVSRELGHHWSVGFSLNNLALAAAMRGDLARATALAEEALELFRAQGIRGGVVELLITRGQIACAQGEYERAQTTLAEGVAQGWPGGPHWLVATGLEQLARVAVAQRQAAHAVRLCAAAATWRTGMGAPLPPYRHAAYEATLAAARGALGEDDFAAAWAEGAAWRPEQAVAAALAAAPAVPGPPFGS
jgi:WD40 repeat protein/predicted ATPase/DNA-binding SARP family transcriptional activator